VTVTPHDSGADVRDGESATLVPDGGDEAASGDGAGNGSKGGVADGRSDTPRVCAYCGRAFARADWLALHRGLDHGDRLDAAEREAYERAREAEQKRLRLFRLKALGVLVVLYFGFVMAYSFFG
jgi:hypothetical protein